MLTVNEARSFPTVQNAKRGAKQVRGKGRTKLHEWESTKNRNENPKERGPTGLTREEKMA